MASLFLRNLLFTILHPGIVVGLIPYWMLRNEWAGIFAPYFHFWHYTGAFLFLMGLAILLSCIFQFAVQGKGTLSPADPTKKLVIKGLYRFSRNPMYLGVLTALVGMAVFTKTIEMFIYTAIVFVIFVLFVTLLEEPRLRKDFGLEYEQYCQRVGRWI